MIILDNNDYFLKKIASLDDGDFFWHNKCLLGRLSTAPYYLVRGADYADYAETMSIINENIEEKGIHIQRRDNSHIFMFNVSKHPRIIYDSLEIIVNTQQKIKNFRDAVYEAIYG